MGSVLAAIHVVSVLLIFFGLGLFLKRHVLNKRPLPTAAQQAGLGETPPAATSPPAGPSRPSR